MTQKQQDFATVALTVVVMIPALVYVLIIDPDWLWEPKYPAKPVDSAPPAVAPASPVTAEAIKRFQAVQALKLNVLVLSKKILSPTQQIRLGTFLQGQKTLADLMASHESAIVGLSLVERRIDEADREIRHALPFYEAAAEHYRLRGEESDSKPVRDAMARWREYYLNIRRDAPAQRERLAKFKAELPQIKAKLVQQSMLIRDLKSFIDLHPAGQQPQDVVQEQGERLLTFATEFSDFDRAIGILEWGTPDGQPPQPPQMQPANPNPHPAPPPAPRSPEPWHAAATTAS